MSVNHKPLTKLVLLLVMVGALALAGCGGDDGYSISAEDQARIDMLTADLADATKKATDAQTEVGKLKTQIGMMNDDASTEEGASLYAQLNAKMAELTAAQGEVTRLTDVIGMMPTDDAAGSGLKGDLDAAQKRLDAAQTEVGKLTATIGADPTEADPNGSGLMGDLAMAKADLTAARGMVTTLTTQLGERPSDDGAVGGSGVLKQLADAEAKIASLEMTLGMEATDDAEATGLRKQLADAVVAREMYKTRAATLAGTLGMEATDDAEATGLYKDLDDAKAKIASLEKDLGMADDPTTPDVDETDGARGQLAKAQADLKMYMDMVGMVDDPDTADVDEAKGLRGDLAKAEAARDMYRTQIGMMGDDASTEEGATLYAQLNAKQAEIDDLKGQLATANQRIQSLQQQQTAQASIARGSAYQLAMTSNLVPARSTTAATAVANTSRQLPFRIASTGGAANHDISVTTGGGITLTPAAGPAFQGATSIPTSPPAPPAATAWHTATMTRNVTPATTVSFTGTETAVVYTDTVNKQILNQYAYFGWWERRPTLVGTAHSVEAFAGGTNPAIGTPILTGTLATAAPLTVATFAPPISAGSPNTLLTSPTDVVGTAVYNGVAAGKYANRTVGAGNVVTSIDSGSFTANATLTANFGTPGTPLATVATNLGLAVTGINGVLVNGAVSQFRLDNGSGPRPSPAAWVVALNRDNNGLGSILAGAVGAPGANDTNLLSGTTTLTIGPGIQRTGAGNWVGEFFGPRTFATANGPQVRAPQTIVGTFDASDRAANPLLTIHGAFGAQAP